MTAELAGATRRGVPSIGAARLGIDDKTNTAVELSGTHSTAESRLIGRYEIFMEIASGGMAEIFLARQMGPEGFHRPVVIKRILRHLAKDEGFVGMFLDEARIGARITHPNVVQIYDFGRSGDTYYIALEYLLGETLSHAVNALKKLERRFDPALAAYVIGCAAAGLHAAHELRGPDGELVGVVHRDVSPQNVFLTYDGNVKVLDFGIAKAAGRATVTRDGQVKGKFAYMAPEQARGEEVDRRTDVWSLGVLLYEMTTGTRLFEGPGDVGLLYRVLNEDIVPPAQLVDDYPAELEGIVLRCLEREPHERFASARELKRALDHFMASQGRPAGSHQLSEVMDELFETRQRRKQVALEGLRLGGEPIETAFEKPSDASLDLPPARHVANARSAPPPPMRRRPNKAMIAVIGLGIVVGVATALLATSGRSDEETTPPVPALTPVVATADPEPVVSEAAAPSEPGCRIESEPAGASAWIGNNRVCESTPCAIAACDENVELRLHGHEPIVVRPLAGRVFAELAPEQPRGNRRARVARRGAVGTAATTARAGSVVTETPQAPTMQATVPATTPPTTTETPATMRGPRPTDLPPL